MPILLDSGESRIRRTLDFSALLCGLIALGLLVIEFGVPLTPERRLALLGLVRAILWAIVIVQIARALLDVAGRRRAPGCILRLMVRLTLVLPLVLETSIVPPLAVWAGLAEAQGTLLYLTTLHIAGVSMLASRLLDLNEVLAFARVSPRAILIGSYLLLIFLGTVLLKLPNSTQAPLSWIDALFTSTSAVSVTGLIVVDTATVFTPGGQAILLFLFQLGGLGLMTFTYFFVALFGRGLTLKDRSLLLEFLNEDNVGRIKGSLIALIVMTLVFEAIGAILLWTATPGDAKFASLFHAVSAFCNAGFSIYTEGLYDPLTRGNVPYQVVIMILIVIGGLGFPVLKNLWDYFRTRLRRTRDRLPRLTTHSRLVLVTTAVLIVAGTVLVLALEAAPDSDGRSTEGLLTAVFTSITSRTAGFNTVPVDAFSSPTVVVIMVLMFIGGSPASTAGGIKTTTAAVALLNTLRILSDAGQELVAFRRQIPPWVATRAFAVALLAVGWVTSATIILLWTMPDHPPLDVAFEAVSAFATVGLSRGITAELTTTGKLVIALSMLVGRIGILYLALGILRRARAGRLTYPEGNVIIS